MRGGRRGNHDFFGPRVVTNSRNDRERNFPNDRERNDSIRDSSARGIQVLSRPRDEEPRRTAVKIVSRAPTEQDYRGQPRVVLPSPQAKEPKGEAQMVDSRKFINDAMMIEDLVLEYLTDNPHFTVTSAIGPQSGGKSTILSMLAGNAPQDKYRYYVFRPASREAIESSRYQTIKINVYVSKSRGIFLDCQATNCASLIEDVVRHSRSMKIDDRCEVSAYVETLQLVSFLLQISHTVLVCSEVTIDMELVKILRMAEIIRANYNNFPTSNLPALNLARKTNIVFVHTRATSVDFSTAVNVERIQLIRAIFADSTRLRIPDDDECVLLKLSVLKPRRDTATGMYSHPALEQLIETEEVESFDRGIRSMRRLLASLPCDSFSEQTFTEKHWYALARAVWKDPSFSSAIDKLATLM